MERVLTETKVKKNFTEHDLRAKFASDAATLEHAKSLLAHADSRLIERVYRRKPERIIPAKLRFQ
jgi:integrase